MLGCLEGDAGILKLEPGRANGLVGLSLPNGLAGLSEVWLICDGRLTKGLVFSGESEPALVGERLIEAVLVGEGVGVVARTVIGEAVLFCRLKGDCRPESKESGDGRCGVACSWLAAYI